MNNEEKYDYWEDIATYDLETAEDMLLPGRYLYVVFMCQQAIEKLAKGLYVLYKDEEPPRIHNIWNIFDRIFDIDKFEEKEKQDVEKTFSFLMNCWHTIYQKNTLLINKNYHNL